MIKIFTLLLFVVVIVGFSVREILAPSMSDHGHLDHSEHMNQTAHEERQAGVAERGVDVMPFNLHDTIHHFVKNSEGGIQQVVARLPDNVDQVQLVRDHLKEIRERFLQGDFSGPAHIHGSDMPGLRELKESEPGQIKITYADIASGAELSYQTSNTRLVTALHTWFDAQLSDHGEDANDHHAVSVQQ